MSDSLDVRSGDSLALLASLVDDVGARWAAATAVLTAMTVAVDVAGAPAWVATLALLVAAGLCVRRMPVIAAVATAIVGWALETGFVVNAYGQLTFTAADILRMALFVAVVSVACPVRRRDQPGPHRPSLR